MKKYNYSLIIHGGCGSFKPNDNIEKKHQEQQKASLKKIIQSTWKLVVKGNNAIDIVEKTITMLEDDPSFNAGIGAAIGKNKQIELDASIMDGNNLDCGAVTGISGYKNPISIARKVLNTTPHTFLAGTGANAFARNNNFKKTPLQQFYTPYQLYWWKILKSDVIKKYRQAKGTVGVVVRDKKGNLAAGTSTGGLTNKMKGRVGDSPLIGAGTYADNRYGGASATGNGEQIMKIAMTKLAIDAIRFQNFNAQQAAKLAIKELGKLKNGKGGIIILDKNSNIGAAANEEFLPRAYMSNTMSKPIIAFTIE